MVDGMGVGSSFVLLISSSTEIESQLSIRVLEHAELSSHFFVYDRVIAPLLLRPFVLPVTTSMIAMFFQKLLLGRQELMCEYSRGNFSLLKELYAYT